jgi:proteic killer suppression protein
LEPGTFRVTFANMILSIRHKGIRLFFEKGDTSKLQAQHVNKIRLILTRLHAAKAVSDMNIPGYGLHQLSGEFKGFWAVKIDKNYRIIFQFSAEDAQEVDYLDYH